MSVDEICIERRFDEIWRTGEELGLSSADVHDIFTSVLREEKEVRTDVQSYTMHREREKRGLVGQLHSLCKYVSELIICLTVICVLLFVVVSFHNPTRKLVTRNIQDLIYPAMTTIRFITLPLLTKFPYLSKWYWEECLVANSFFDQLGINCTPCTENSEPIKASNLDNFTDMYYNNGKIVIITDGLLQTMTWTDLTEKLNTRDEVDIGSLTYSSNTKKSADNLQQCMREKQFSDDAHVEWKINRLETLHVVRKVFPRLYFIPKHTEVAFHRYVFIDGPRADSYRLPLTEFANVVLMQGEGKSTFSISPSSHCQDYCSPITVTLKATEVLFFNWIYWRPVRVSGEGISTLAMSSFY